MIALGILHYKNEKDQVFFGHHIDTKIRFSTFEAKEGPKSSLSCPICFTCVNLCYLGMLNMKPNKRKLNQTKKDNIIPHLFSRRSTQKSC